MSKPSTDAEPDGAPYAEQTAITRVLGDHPKVKILSVLSSQGRDISVSQIAEQSGMSRSTVYNHIDDLQAVNVVVQTRKVGGSPLYQLNRDDEAAEKFAQLEWAVIDNVADA